MVANRQGRWAKVGPQRSTRSTASALPQAHPWSLHCAWTRLRALFGQSTSPGGVFGRRVGHAGVQPGCVAALTAAAYRKTKSRKKKQSCVRQSASGTGPRATGHGLGVLSVQPPGALGAVLIAWFTMCAARLSGTRWALGPQRQRRLEDKSGRTQGRASHMGDGRWVAESLPSTQSRHLGSSAYLQSRGGIPPQRCWPSVLCAVPGRLALRCVPGRAGAGAAGPAAPSACSLTAPPSQAGHRNEHITARQRCSANRRAQPPLPPSWLAWLAWLASTRCCKSHTVAHRTYRPCSAR